MEAKLSMDMIDKIVWTRKLDTIGRELISKYLVDCKVIADIGHGGYPIRMGAIGYDRNRNIPNSKYFNMDKDVVWLKDDLIKENISGVCMSHSLEHFINTKVVLKALFIGIKNKGRIAVVVPDGETVPSNTLGDSGLTHEVLFTPITLRLHLEHAGFKNVKSQYYERPYAYKQTKGIFACGEKDES